MQFDVGAFTGLTAFSSTSGLGNAASASAVPGTAVAVGVHAGALLHGGRVGIEAEFRDALTTLGGGAGAAQVLGLHAQGLWYFKTEGGVRPFAVLGGGINWLVTEGKPCGTAKPPAKNCIFVKSPDDDKAFYVGGGARIPLTHRIALRGEARWLVMDGRPGTPKVPAPAFAMDNAEWHFGAVVAFGGRPADEDKDGIPDEQDKCLLEAEDRDGFQDHDGCPELDNDNDGIEDTGDGCPEEPEDMDKFEDGDGCPDPDNDMDGILDANDRCIDKAETPNGIDDSDGCPDQLGEAVARLFGGPVAGLEWKGAALQKASESVLEPLLELMLEHDHLKVEVIVAADAEGDPGRKLAEQRLKGLRGWLEERGIDGTRLFTQAGPVAPQVVGAKPAAKGVSRPAVTLRLLGK